MMSIFAWKIWKGREALEKKTLMFPDDFSRTEQH